MDYEGRVWKFGDNVDTDLIIPARFLNESDETILAGHCFSELRPDFAEEVKQGDILVAGTNFGCGSSREHAPLAIKASGIRLIVAQSYARIFYRNAFNIGLPALEAEEPLEGLRDRIRVSVSLESGRLRDLESGRIYRVRPIPPFMREIIRAGGLVPYVKGRARAEGNWRLY